MFFGMPVLWRYLTGQFLKILIFSTVALVLCLLTLRLEEIAHFASLDSSMGYLAAFVLYQIPYILPIAIPLSCLISAMILMGRLSSTHEITALRALGYSLSKIFQPLLLIAVILSVLNFFITSEIATLTHLKTARLKTELRSVNPLLILHNKHLLRSKGIFFDALGASKMGELASDVILIIPGKKGSRMNLLAAKKLESRGETFYGENVTLITSLGPDGKVGVENIGKTDSAVEDFSDLMQKKAWSINDDYLGMKFLLIRLNELSQQANESTKNEVKTQNRLISEMARRLSLGLAPFTFTLLGLAFGLSISRKESRKGVIAVAGLAAFYLVTFFLAKGLGHKFEATLLLYSVPHLILIGASFYQLRKISRGIEK